MTAWEKLKAQREGGEPLDLLGEAHRAEGSVWSVALPPLDGASGFHATLEGGLGHQVEGQRLRLGGARAAAAAAGVVRAVNVQVVVEVHLDGQISSCQPCVCRVPVHDVSLGRGGGDDVEEENRGCPRGHSSRCPRDGAHTDVSERRAGSGEHR